jgi:hypothetical protein
MKQVKWACSLCGSRDWPNTYTSCPACYGEPDPEPEYEPDEYEHEQ